MKPFTKHEDQLIIKLFPTHRLSNLCVALHRSRQSVSDRVRELGLARSPGQSAAAILKGLATKAKQIEDGTVPSIGLPGYDSTPWPRPTTDEWKALDGRKYEDHLISSGTPLNGTKIARRMREVSSYGCAAGMCAEGV